MTLRLSPINHRHQLAKICKYEHAVEVGTHRGVFAEELCRIRDGGVLYCIDPWVPYPQDEFLADKGATRNHDLVAAKALLKPYIASGRCHLHRMTSLAAADVCPERKLCLAYIDADHRYEEAAADIAAWWPKVRPGGILAGHDFICPGETCNDGVQRAVLEFMADTGLDVQLVPENGPKTAGFAWSWYVEKPL